jgi:hypothetical protein
VDVLKKQALVGTARKAFSRVPCFLGIKCGPTHYLRSTYLKISESVARSKVSDQCSSMRAAPARNSGR